MDDLQFLVMLGIQGSRGDVLDIVLKEFPEAAPRKANSCDLRGNWLEVWANEDADPHLASGDDGFLHYRWRVEVTPSARGRDEAGQVALAGALQSCFERAGGVGVVCAAFEERL